MITMRDAFFDKLYELARKDPDVVLVDADMGAPSLDKFRKDVPAQFVNVGIAEQNAIAIATGLAFEGKKAFAYAIAPFITLRCYEQIKVNMSSMGIPVTAVGVGAGFSYEDSGPTHHTTEDISIMRALPNMTIFNPSDSIMSGAIAKLSYELPGPKYVRFDRTGIPDIYKSAKEFNLKEGLAELKRGSDLCIVATGTMVRRALDVSEELSKHSVKTGVVDLFRIKPVNDKKLLEIIGKSSRVVTLEEHFVTGGIGSALAELMVDKNKARPMLRLGICDKYFFEYGGRDALHCLIGLDRKSITKKLLNWLSVKKRVTVHA